MLFVTRFEKTRLRHNIWYDVTDWSTKFGFDSDSFSRDTYKPITLQYISFGLFCIIIIQGQIADRIAFYYTVYTVIIIDIMRVFIKLLLSSCSA